MKFKAIALLLLMSVQTPYAMGMRRKVQQFFSCSLCGNNDNVAEPVQQLAMPVASAAIPDPRMTTTTDISAIIDALDDALINLPADIPDLTITSTTDSNVLADLLEVLQPYIDEATLFCPNRVGQKPLFFIPNKDFFESKNFKIILRALKKIDKLSINILCYEPITPEHLRSLGSQRNVTVVVVRNTKGLYYKDRRHHKTLQMLERKGKVSYLDSPRRLPKISINSQNIHMPHIYAAIQRASRSKEEKRLLLDICKLLFYRNTSPYMTMLSDTYQRILPHLIGWIAAIPAICKNDEELSLIASKTRGIGTSDIDALTKTLLTNFTDDFQTRLERRRRPRIERGVINALVTKLQAKLTAELQAQLQIRRPLSNTSSSSSESLGFMDTGSSAMSTDSLMDTSSSDTLSGAI